jgi:alkyl hydroperoxide reductase subunit AhpC
LNKFDEAGAQLLGMSVDSQFALRTWAVGMGGIRHPLLTDFWPHGEVSRKLGIFNEDSGITMRALLIIDPDGVVRHSELHQGTLPDAAKTLEKLAELKA